MKILISAAEASSDAHGAELVKALRLELGSLEGQKLEVFGVGGPKLESCGMNVLMDAREFLAMGFVEILSRLPRIYRALGGLKRAAAELKPDLAILIDYPDFHFRLARRLNRLDIPMIYYIPPKVWVWRKKRVEFLRKFFSRILCILPFEVSFYQRLKIPVCYVGNPLLDELPMELTKREARRKLGLAERDRVFVLMPGSRPSELKLHLRLMIDAVKLAAVKLRDQGYLAPDEVFHILMPFPLTVDLSVIEELIQAHHPESGLKIHVSQGNAAVCLVAAEAGLIKSGTSTLEAGLLGCPHSIIYKTTRTTEWIFKYLIRYRGFIGLVNLVAAGSNHSGENGAQSLDPSGGKPLVREVVMSQVTLATLTSEVISLMTDGARRETLLLGFQDLKKKVSGSGGLSPSRQAAREVIEVLREIALKRESARNANLSVGS